MPKGDAIAYDDRGRPTIVRHVDEQTGVARTVVKNEDGTKRVFGKNTIDSLASSDLEKSKSWAEALTAHQMRGLAHEVGQRLLEGSRLYNSRLTELDKLGEQLNFMYFGLSADASERDIDNAYRKFARKMHPDKNGGTDEAKQKFQQMKERYESLKKKFEQKESQDGVESQDKSRLDDGNAGTAEVTAEQEAPRHRSEESGAPVGPQARDIAAEDAPPEDSDERGGGKYDPEDKVALVKNITRMMKQYKSIETQMEILVKELERAKRAVSAEGAAA